MKRILRQLRGALGNAVLWGISWFAAGFALTTLSHFGGFLPIADPWLLIFYIAVSTGVTGFLTGSVFSAYLRFVYWERPLLDISVGPFALGGAVVAALFSSGVNLTAQLAAGLGMLLPSLVAGGVWAGVLGALTAAASIKVAQRAARTITNGAAEELAAEQREVLSMLAGEGS